MKLSEITKETKFPEFKNVIVSWANSPFWSVNIVPKNNPFELFSFRIHERQYHDNYSCFMYKTSYYQNPVISKDFSKENTLENVIVWIEEILFKIKEKLLIKN